MRAYAIPGGSEEIMQDFGIRQAIRLAQHRSKLWTAAHLDVQLLQLNHKERIFSGKRHGIQCKSSCCLWAAQTSV